MVYYAKQYPTCAHNGRQEFASWQLSVKAKSWIAIIVIKADLSERRVNMERGVHFRY
jgi:hypothetical protein